MRRIGTADRDRERDHVSEFHAGQRTNRSERGNERDLLLSNAAAATVYRLFEAFESERMYKRVKEREREREKMRERESDLFLSSLRSAM